MELKKEFSCLSNNILVSKKCINVNRDYQETLESYLDDILKVIYCDCNSYILSCDIVDNFVIVQGKTQINLVYLNEDKDVTSTDFVEEFTEKIEVNNLSDFAFANCKLCEKFSNYRAINQRRIDVHLSFDLNVFIYDSNSCSCLSNCERLMTKKFLVNELVVSNDLIQKIDFDEEIQFNIESVKIKRLISVDLSPRVIETKAIKDKLFVKIKVDFSVVYSNDQNEYLVEYSYFETSKIFEISDLTEDSNYSISLNNGDIYTKLKSNSNGDNAYIEIYGEIISSISVINNQEKEVIVDGYIIGNKSNNQYSNYLCLNFVGLIEDKSRLKIDVKLKSNVSKVISSNIKVIDTYAKQNALNIKLKTKILYINEDKELVCNSEIVDTKIDINVDNLMGVNFGLDNTEYNIINNNVVELTINYNLSGISYEEKRIDILSELELDSKDVNYSALSLYFASKDDSLWDISKKYSSDVELIKKENNISSNNIENDKIIVIPGL